jgi:signal peptidase I
LPPDDGRPREPGASRIGRFHRWWRSRRFVVREDSMAPLLEVGDRLLVDPEAYRDREPARGDVVVARDPERPGATLVKRVGAIPGDRPTFGDPVPPNTVYLLGDRADLSRDSRAFGPVPRASLVGRVWYRYHPPGRSGPIDGARLK